MKIVCISDTHGRHKKLEVPKGDVLVCTGDVTPRGEMDMIMSFLNWFNDQPHKHKVFIAGNHDWCFCNGDTCIVLDEIRGMENVHYLEDSEVVIDGVKFYGTPWQPEFCNWAFNLPRGGHLSEKWEMIPDDTDVLLTHGPPNSILDVVVGREEENLGCVELYYEVVSRVFPRAHIFGHIHSSHGVEILNNTKFINASVLDENYQLSYQPIVVTI